MLRLQTNSRFGELNISPRDNMDMGHLGISAKLSWFHYNPQGFKWLEM